MKKMDVYFHGQREGTGWRGQVIGNSGALKARTDHLFADQVKAAEAAQRLWESLQKKLQEVPA